MQGNGATVTAEALSPSAHEPGRHGDLLQCVECGTVQQPVLPQGAALHDLYRDMRDDEYLTEEWMDPAMLLACEQTRSRDGLREEALQ